MSKKFVIGDRTKDEYISVLDTEKKKLEFTNHIGSAKEFHGFEETKAILKKLQEETGGYLEDLQVYIKDEDGKAHRPDERDMMPW
ncbi:MAG: hypothetical protein IIU12_05505 [Prevotella sp.]|jgi:hypothetical protein|nr:hypothetical protein [Prevotella sp.]